VTSVLSGPLAPAGIAGPARSGRHDPAPPRGRIVILTEDSKPALGGIAEYLHRLALATMPYHDVLVVTSVTGADALNATLPYPHREVTWFRAQERRGGDAVPPVRYLNTLIWHLQRPRRVRALLADIHAARPDSRYVLGRLSPVTFPWCAGCDALGLPYAAIGYGLELIERLPARLARQRAAHVRRAAQWFAVSQDTRRRLIELGVPAAGVSLLTPGAGPPAPVGADAGCVVRTRLGLGGRPFLFSLGLLRRRKGIDLAIAALAALRDRHPDLLLVVAGDGPEGPALRALAQRLQVADRVIFTGEIDEATKAALFAECQVFVLPTRDEPGDVEGFGIVFLEAALHGKPVVGGNTGGVPDAVADGVTGLLVDTHDATALTAALARLLSDPALQATLGHNGRERARTEFRWEIRGRAFATRMVPGVDPPPDGPSESPDRVSPPRAPGRIARTRGAASRVRQRVAHGGSVLAALARQGRLGAYLAGHPAPADPGAAVQAMLGWLRLAFAAGRDGGAAARYDLARGWAAPYPEVTGYLIPTLLHFATDEGEADLIPLARRAGEWLARTRLPRGAICRKQWRPGNSDPSVFNTAQVIDGWCSLHALGAPHPTTAPDWVALARESGDWLVSEQEPDGSWVRHAFNGSAHSYYARVAAPLARLARATGAAAYEEAARRALDWVVSTQGPDGWFDRAGFTRDEYPTTHTIGYVLEGLVRGGLLLGDAGYIEAADRGARALLGAYRGRGMLAGRYAPGWRPCAHWRCLTGDAQVALTWVLLSRATGEVRYRKAAESIAEGLRRTIRIAPAWPEISGAVQGSWPDWGDYDRYAYPAHAAKYALDLMGELRAGAGGGREWTANP